MECPTAGSTCERCMYCSVTILDISSCVVRNNDSEETLDTVIASESSGVSES